jgi:putative ABC transport system substrate-binding protein
MKKKILVSLLPILILNFVYLVAAQQPTKVARIAYLSAGSAPSQASRVEVFKQGLRDLGYVEGKNIVIESRYAEGDFDRLRTLAVELVHLRIEILVSAGPLPTRAAKEATGTIPIVMTQDTDPIGNGFVASLARPGGNITGLSTRAPELNGKRLELLKEIIPKLSRVAVFGTSTIPGNGRQLKETELAAGAFGMQLQYLDILGPKDIETAFQAASKGRADAVLTLNSAILNSQRKQIVDLAIKSRLPAIYYAPEWVEDGGLMTYGVSFADLYRRAAVYVDKILKGAKPADLPVEQPMKFELVINLKTAKQIGLTIPESVLYRVDRVIK